MKIQLMSDLHIEFRPGQKSLGYINPEADVVVIAGDACDYTNSPRLLSMLRSSDLAGKEVYYVPGNHEFYRAPSTAHTLQSLQETFGGLKELGVRVAYLDSFKTRLRASEGSPVRFVLATLWSDLSNPMDALAAGCLNDFRVPGLTIDWYNEQHQLHKAFIKAQLEAAAKAGGKTVVVTHHCPSHLSTPERFKGDSLGPCFVSDLTGLMHGAEAPVLWMHGHTHHAFDYAVGGTRIVCNPLGYPGEHRYTTDGYKENLLLEI